MGSGPNKDRAISSWRQVKALSPMVRRALPTASPKPNTCWLAGKEQYSEGDFLYYSTPSHLIIGGRLAWSRNYAAKNIKFGVETRALMLKGAEELADAVKVTMGLNWGGPKVTKDGVTVSKSIEFQDKVKNIGASPVKQVAGATNDVAGDVAGDGTTFATVLTHAIFVEGCKSVEAGMNATDLRHWI
ncbi:hypothetical protein GH714_026434 [Hevea brasiliensis]|uniref:Uncharacterized protein n=1 Tax=Hevea brasiliensis TaxID=3981 RepID=A0A6A6KX86_HEVBR|nr:hypothetical protein GH714_026434 [Hevea brasiliensis]